MDHISGHRSAVPFHAQLLPLCRGGTQKTWIIQRRMAQHPADLALSSLGWAWRRPGALNYFLSLDEFLSVDSFLPVDVLSLDSILSSFPIISCISLML